MRKIAKGIIFFSVLTMVMGISFLPEKNVLEKDTRLLFCSKENRAQRIGEVKYVKKKENHAEVVQTDEMISKNGNIEEHKSTKEISIDLVEGQVDKKTDYLLRSVGVKNVYAYETGSQSKKKSDSSGALSVKLTVDYKIDDSSGKGDFITLTKVKTSLSCGKDKDGNPRRRPQSGVSIVSNELTIGAAGFYIGGFKKQSKDYSLPTTAYSKKITPPKAWKAIEFDTGTAGAYQRVELKRGNRSKWCLEISCNPADNGMSLAG